MRGSGTQGLPLAAGSPTAAQLRAALQAMQLLQPFAPRLAGALADGTADPRLPIVLHLQAEHADDVLRFLAEHGIPARMRETRMYLPRAPAQTLPGVGFLAGDQEFQIWIFTEGQFRQRARIGDESIASRRLTRATVEAWLATEGAGAG
jgi:hypothetical protein